MKETRILILEHDVNDLELLMHVLKKGELKFNPVIVETREQYEEALIAFCPQIILSDYTLPSFDGLSAFKIKQTICPNTPFIIVSGTIGEENAVELIKLGVTDYVLKEKMYQVIPKIQRALKEAWDFEQKCIAENDLKESRQQLQKIMDQSLDMICIFDSEGLFVEVSAASYLILGYLPEELINRNARELIHPEDLKKTERMVSQILLGKEVVHFENRYIRKNGEIVPVFWTVQWAENENVAYCVGRDASAIKQAEAELAEHNQQINNILESITDGFISLNRSWNVTYWNREAEYILGSKREDIINKNIWEVYKEAIPLKFYSEYHLVMNKAVSSTFEEYFPPIKAWIRVSAYPSKDGISIFFKDITESKRVEKINNLQKEVLELYTRKGSTIEETISLLLEGIQQIHPELMCSILRLENGKLNYWFSPHLPETYTDRIKSVPLGPEGGICGMAALLKKEVVVTDISKDPLFKNYYDLAAEHNLKACTSFPICDPYHKVLGTFVIYLNTARALSPGESASLERAKFILQHIIENHTAEIALKESEGRYRDIFQLSPLPMWVYDPDTTRFLYVNDAAIRHYGYSIDEFLGMTIKDIRPKDAWKNLQSTVDLSKNRCSFFQGTFDHLKKNGELIKVFIQSNLIDFGDRKARMVLAMDITEKLKFEETLDFSEKRFKAMVQEGSDFINIFDMEGNYKYASPASATLMGMEPEEYIDKNFLSFIHEEDKEIIAASLSSVKDTRRIETQPFRFKDFAGEYRWLQAIITNLLNDPAIQGIIVNARDITESVNYIQAIEEQNASLRDIAWIQSHIVRAPLSRIMGLIDLISNYPNEKEAISELLGHILTSAHELDDVIRTIVRKSEHAEKMSDIKNKLPAFNIS